MLSTCSHSCKAYINLTNIIEYQLYEEKEKKKKKAENDFRSFS